MANQGYALGHIQFVLGNIIVADGVRRRVGGQFKVSGQGSTGGCLHLLPHPLHARRSILTGQFGDEHGLQRVHGTADVAVSHLLVEHQAESIAPLPVLSSSGERVKLWLDAVFLRAKLEPCRQREHANSVTVERIVGHILRIVGQGFALVRTIQWGAVQVVA